MGPGGSRAHTEPGRIRVDVPEGAACTFCEQNAVRELSLFGSVLREDFTPESDIDVLPTCHLTLAVLAQMEDDLPNVDVQIVGATAAHDLPRLANLAAAPSIANKPVAPRRPEGITAT